MGIQTLNERAALARKRAGFKKPADAAKAIGCSRPTVIRWEEDPATVSIGGKYLLPAAKAYKVRPEWLSMQSADDGYPFNVAAGVREESAAYALTEQAVSPEGRADNNIEAVRVALVALTEVLIETTPSAAGLLERALIAGNGGKAREKYTRRGLLGQIREVLDGAIASQEEAAAKPRRRAASST